MSGTRPWLKYVGIGCGGLLVAVVALVGVIFFTVGKLTAEPERVVTEFLAAVSAGDLEKAHGFFSVPLKEAQPLEAFAAAVRARPSLFDVADTSFSSRSIDTAGAKFEGTATLRAGTEVPVSFSLVQENGAWRLIAYQVGSRD